MKSCILFLSVVIIAEILLSASLVTAVAAMNGNRSWNGSVSYAAGEFMMNDLDDINWEVTLANAGNTISYKGLQKPPICNEKIYGNCFGDKKPEQRPCTLYNTCDRPG